MNLFTKEDRSSFPYWFAHWCAFNMTALVLKIWKPKYLFHDFEKPWLMWLWKDYKRVQKWHREHNRHHIDYTGKKGWDFDAMIIDWECSRFTKESAPWNAWMTLEKVIKVKYPDQYEEVKKHVVPRMIELGLNHDQNL